MHEKLIINARTFENGFKRLVSLFVMLEDLQHGGVFIAEYVLDGPVLRRLQPGGRSQDMPEFRIFAGRQGLQHSPLLEQLPLDHLDPRENLEARIERIPAYMGASRFKLMQSQLEPELRGLVLDDKQQFIMMRWIAQRVLRIQEPMQAKIIRIGSASL